MFLRCKFLHWQHEEFSQEKCEFILKEGKPTSNGLSPLFPKKKLVLLWSQFWTNTV
jgi:hypothetical protein